MADSLCFLNRKLRMLKNLIFPPRCMFCRKLLPVGAKMNGCLAVSYTHLDVYKRQECNHPVCVFINGYHRRFAQNDALSLDVYQYGCRSQIYPDILCKSKHWTTPFDTENYIVTIIISNISEMATSFSNLFVEIKILLHFSSKDFQTNQKIVWYLSYFSVILKQ